MTAALKLFVALACLGAFDTLYYHEWRARLPAMGPLVRSELQLHALRDFVYAIIFATLPWVAWQGRYVVPLIVLLVIEIVLTLWDFVVEDWVRKPLGGVYPGERVMHGIMGIVYGAALAYLVPVLRVWWSRPTRLAIVSPANSIVLGWILAVMAWGVVVSGVRDLCAALAYLAARGHGQGRNRRRVRIRSDDLTHLHLECVSSGIILGAAEMAFQVICLDMENVG